MADVDLKNLSTKDKEPRSIGDKGRCGVRGQPDLHAPALRDSIVRHGKATSDRAKSQTVFSNFFLHIMSVRTHVHSIKPPQRSVWASRRSSCSCCCA